MGVKGRLTLKATLDSIKEQERVPGDRVIVCLDSFEQGDRPDVRQLVESYGEGFEFHAVDAGYHFFGVPQENHAFSLVDERSSHILTLGDDDVFTEGAWAALRPFCAQYPLRPIAYRMVLTGYGLLWDIPAMRRCHISGQSMIGPRQFVCPQDTRLDCTVDFDRMEHIVKESGQDPLWLDYVGLVAHSDGVQRSVWRCWLCGRYGYNKPNEGHMCCGTLVDRNPAPRIVEQVPVPA